MRYKELERAGVKISSLTVGSWAIGGEGWGDVNTADSIAAVHKMFDLGVNVIDTAPAYGSGHSEEVVGQAIKGYRDKIFVSTKFGLDPAKDWAENGTYDFVMKECEDSLRRLDTDYIDFYFMHWPDPNTPIEETMKALNVLKEQGKIRFIGVSNFNKDQILEAEKYGQIDVIQPPYSMVNRSAEELMKWAKSKGMDTFTYGSLGAGILTGTIRELPDFAEDDYRKEFYDFYTEPKFSRVMELLKTLDKIAEKREKPVAQVAINWSTQKDYVGTAMCGVRKPSEAEENCAAFEWSLEAEEMKMIDGELERLAI